MSATTAYSTSKPRPRSPTPWVGIVLGVLGTVVVGALLWRGLPYYALGSELRIDAPMHRALRPSGTLGHGYGVVGTALILSNLLYLVRRRLAHVRWLGSMRGWLAWHVLSGLVGPGLVLLHSAFTLRTVAAGIAGAALGVVVLTGLIGRYLYGLVPRARSGEARTLDELRTELDRSFMGLRRFGEGGVKAAELVEREVDAALGARARAEDGMAAIAAAVRGRLALRGLAKRAREAARAAGEPESELRAVERAARDLAGLQLRADAYATFAGALASWRAIHRVLAVVMVVAAGLHVTIALYLGYGL